MTEDNGGGSDGEGDGGGAGGGGVGAGAGGGGGGNDRPGSANSTGAIYDVRGRQFYAGFKALF